MLLPYVMYTSETAFRMRKKNVRWDLILTVGSGLDGCGLLLVDLL